LFLSDFLLGDAFHDGILDDFGGLEKVDDLVCFEDHAFELVDL
jgi:hypothetical protein